MAKIKGYQINVSGVSIGQEQSCSLSIQNNIQEVEVKDSENPLSPPQEKVSAQWNMQQTAKIENASSVKTIISTALNQDNADSVSMVTYDGSTLFSGSAFVGDVNISAPNRGNIIANVTYSGTGPLTKTSNNNS